MPFMILYGGELVFLFLAARIARWMWRSREQVIALWHARHGAAPSEPSLPPEPNAAPRPRPPLRIRPLPRRRRAREAARAA